MKESGLATLALAMTRTMLRSPALPAVARLSTPALRRLRPAMLHGATLPEAVESLLGPMSARKADAIACEILVNWLRSQSLRALRGIAGNAGTFGLVRWTNPDALLERYTQRRPAILASWHLAPELGTGVALESLGIPGTVFRTAANGNPRRDSRVVDYQSVADPLDRGLVLRHALARLKKGGVVALAVDGRQSGSPVEVPFLGRKIRVGRGAAALARLSGAPIIPVAKTWGDDGVVEIRCFQALERPPIDPREAETFDLTVVSTIVRWFDAFIRTEPGQLRVARLGRLYATARVDPVTSSSSYSDR